MKIRVDEIERLDTMEATVIGFGRDHALLRLDSLEVAENEAPPRVYLYDYIGMLGDRLLVSVSKIGEDLRYIRVRYDAMRYDPIAA